MNPKLRKFLKEVLFHTPLRPYLFPRQAVFNFNAAQLCFLCQCVEQTRAVPGAIAEVGCASGATTVFLNNYMDARGIEKPYYAVDTFAGFVADDVDYEVTHRGKNRAALAVFQLNKKKWFDATMRENNIVRVRSIETDVNVYDLKTLAPLSFVLLDVDLYQPMKKSLNELYAALSPGGMMVVDDCDTADVRWDGADQAYREFMLETQQAIEIVHGKLGIVRKS